MTQWYYRDFQSKKIGPLSTEEFELCIADGAILPGTRVWRSGLTDWTTYEALIAHDSSCLAVASGPHSSAAPHSSSRSLAGGPDVSALHHRNDGAGAVTPSATPPQVAPQFEPCHGCGEEMPSHLFGAFGGRRLCGTCVLKARAGEKRERLRDAKGPNSHWLLKHFLWLALISGVIVALRIGLMEMGGASAEATRTLPLPENLSTAPSAR